MNVAAAWAIVLAGGRGTRFWPLSRRGLPKQCLSLDGGPTLLQRAIARAGVPAERVVIVTGPDMVEVVRSQAGGAHVIVEPSARGTAPAIALGVAEVARRGGEQVLVLPADHVVRDEVAFAAAVRAAQTSIEDGALVVFGVAPTRPETGFGWVLASDATPSGTPRVARFVEKPPLHVAQALLAQGARWNAGIFAGRVDAFVQAFARHLPRTACLLQADVVTETAWFSTEATSIDHGVMEPAAGDGALVMVPVACGWSDLGAWSALGDVLGEGEGGAVLAREVVAIDARGNSVVAPERLVALLGVEDLVVVDTPDVLLVTTRDRAQDVRTLVDEVERRGGARYT